MKTEIILKSDSFSYPTKDERKEIEKRIPKINRWTPSIAQNFARRIKEYKMANKKRQPLSRLFLLKMSNSLRL